MRTFETGATRDSDAGKNDYEGYLSPIVLEAFGDYMTVHRVQPDGQLRDSDNWQKGMGLSTFIKSLWRHFMDLWKLHRGYKVFDKKDGHQINVREACCAIIFNVQGYLHEWLIANEHFVKDLSFNPEEYRRFANADLDEIGDD